MDSDSVVLVTCGVCWGATFIAYNIQHVDVYAEDAAIKGYVLFSALQIFSVWGFRHHLNQLGDEIQPLVNKAHEDNLKSTFTQRLGTRGLMILFVLFPFALIKPSTGCQHPTPPPSIVGCFALIWIYFQGYLLIFSLEYFSIMSYMLLVFLMAGLVSTSINYPAPCINGINLNLPLCKLFIYFFSALTLYMGALYLFISRSKQSTATPTTNKSSSSSSSTAT